MATAGKSSLKRGKPNYIYSIVGVALVLFMMGIMGWFFLNSKEIATKLKEDIKISVYLRTLIKIPLGKFSSLLLHNLFLKMLDISIKQKPQKFGMLKTMMNGHKFLT
jgi:cell division transport system permease protein